MKAAGRPKRWVVANGLSLFVVLVALGFALPLIRRGIVLSDEGYLLQQALDLLNGRVLYRDMDAFITPGMWFLLAGLFALFEPSVLLTRYLMWIAFGVLAFTGFRIVQPVSGRWAGLGAVLGLMTFAVWAFPAWTFAFYSPMAILFALLGLERLLAWQREGRSAQLFWVGLWLGLAIVFKQNYGVYAVAAASLGWGVTRFGPAPASGSRSPVAQDIGRVVLGGLVAGLPFVFYLLANGALGDAWYSLVVHPFEFAGRHDIPFASLGDLVRPEIYTDLVDKLTYLAYPLLRVGPVEMLQPIRGTQRLHVLAYWLPLLSLGAGLLLSVGAKRRAGARLDLPLFTVVLFALALFLGVLPRADFNHLMNVYQPALIAFPVVVQRTYALLGARSRWALALGVALIVTPYTLIAASWYQGLIRTHHIEVGTSRGGVLVDDTETRKLDDLLRTLDGALEPGEALLTIPDLVMLNFLTDHPVPSPYYNLYEHHIAADRGASVVAGAEASGVRIIVTRYDNFFSDRVGILDYAPPLTDYVATHFDRDFIGPGQEYMVFRRRDAPKPKKPWVDVLATCTSEGDDTALSDIRRHLLFGALYHRSRPGEPLPPDGLTTRCRVRVPEQGGELIAELGYLRPSAVRPGTQLVAEVALIDAQERTRLAYETLRVVPFQGARREQPYIELAVPLSDWAGQEVDLVFHTRLSGGVRAHPLDWRGFAMVYRDPRLVERDSSE